MSQIMFRVYRTNNADEFGSGKKFLTFKPCQMWVPSESLGNTDVYSNGEADHLIQDWNEYWASKGMDYRAHKERAIG